MLIHKEIVCFGVFVSVVLVFFMFILAVMIKGVGPPLATCCPRLPEKGGGGEVEKEEKEGEEGGEKEKGEEEEGGMVSTQQPPSNHPSFPPLPLLGWGGGGRGATPPRFNPLGSHARPAYFNTYFIEHKNYISRKRPL